VLGAGQPIDHGGRLAFRRAGSRPVRIRLSPSPLSSRARTCCASRGEGLRRVRGEVEGDAAAVRRREGVIPVGRWEMHPADGRQNLENRTAKR